MSLEAAEEALIKANDCYRQGLFDGAAQGYTEALKAAASSSASIALLCRIHSNRAQALLQLREYDRAVENCNHALAYDGSNIKALIRRATARAALEECDAAAQDLQEALALGPPPMLVRAINAVREQVRSMQKLAVLPQNMRGDTEAANGLVQKEQTLRLFYKARPPDVVGLGRWCDVSIYLANEFGLWKRADYPGTGDLTLSCSIIPSPCEPNTRGGELEVEVQGDAVFHPGTSCRSSFRVRFRKRLITEQHTAISPPLSWNCHLMTSLDGGGQSLSRTVLPVISTRITVHDLSTEHVEPVYVQDPLGIQNCRGIYLPALERRVLVAESPGQLGLAGKVWDASLVLLQFLAAHRNKVAWPSRCVELGAGTGLCGIACTMLGGAEMTITDLESVVELISRNITLNLGSQSTTRAAAHAWGTLPAVELGAPFDVIIMSDVVYDPVCYEPLVKSIIALSHGETLVLLAHRTRNKDNSIFFESMEKHFKVEEVARGQFGVGGASLTSNEYTKQPEQHLDGDQQPGPCSDVRVLEMRPIDIDSSRSAVLPSMSMPGDS